MEDKKIKEYGCLIMSRCFNEEAFKKAAEESCRLQKIQMIVWDYMRTPKHKRDGVEMAIKISNLFKDKNV